MHDLADAIYGTGGCYGLKLEGTKKDRATETAGSSSPPQGECGVIDERSPWWGMPKRRLRRPATHSGVVAVFCLDNHADFVGADRCGHEDFGKPPGKVCQRSACLSIMVISICRPQMARPPCLNGALSVHGAKRYAKAVPSGLLYWAPRAMCTTPRMAAWRLPLARGARCHPPLPFGSAATVLPSCFTGRGPELAVFRETAGRSRVILAFHVAVNDRVSPNPFHRNGLSGARQRTVLRSLSQAWTPVADQVEAAAKARTAGLKQSVIFLLGAGGGERQDLPCRRRGTLQARLEDAGVPPPRRRPLRPGIERF